MFKHIIDAIDKAIFAIRWLLVPMYLALYGVLAVYIWKYIETIWDVIAHVQTLDSKDIMLIIVELVDMGMIANLVVMTTQGGYSIFVREFKADFSADRPRWLNKDFSSAQQKIKFGMSLTAISMINMFNSSVKTHGADWNELLKECLVIGTLLAGTLGYCLINTMTHPAHPAEKEPHETPQPDHHQH